MDYSNVAGRRGVAARRVTRPASVLAVGLATAVAACAAGAGCSIIAVRPVPANEEAAQGEPPPVDLLCTSDRYAPTVDLALMAGSVAGAVEVDGDGSKVVLALLSLLY